MLNAAGEPQNIVVLGGSSDIGVAIARRLAAPSTKSIVLACRRPDEAPVDGLRRPGLEVQAVSFDAVRVEHHASFVDSLVAAHGDIDVAVVAFGQLGEQSRFGDDPVAAADLVTVNFAGAVSVLLALARVMRRQGHGRIVVLSSVAGERVRPANMVYGATKAGLDGFSLALGDSLVTSGVGVLVVRPGFVRSAMTQGMEAAPFATTPDAVADATVKALRAGRRIVWAPGILRYVFMVLRHLPAPLWRRLPLG
ncbi:MAG: decaprenylphospho-beta-D-erythro-pentofuranosid-2-ulose 2-reductase [Acidimicrobiales bacterium mtb01]|nr:decaprenylphospho-beta-D-erythro-pentofuranosid-2-ulose 2-reductase [Actinomycetota bacterium]TEX45099.1 MAG: decaprenylphospho-beta-D-erythro-pentofuranosid-2-ulose 2-reductase [Acidimicrobiales bacterium mtb01]